MTTGGIQGSKRSESRPISYNQQPGAPSIDHQLTHISTAPKLSRPGWGLMTYTYVSVALRNVFHTNPTWTHTHTPHAKAYSGDQQIFPHCPDVVCWVPDVCGPFVKSVIWTETNWPQTQHHGFSVQDLWKHLRESLEAQVFPWWHNKRSSMLSD